MFFFCFLVHFAVMLSNLRLVETTHFEPQWMSLLLRLRASHEYRLSYIQMVFPLLGKWRFVLFTIIVKQLTREWTKSVHQINLEESFFSDITIILKWVLFACTCIFIINYCKTLYLQTSQSLYGERRGKSCKSSYLTLPFADVGKQFKCLTFLLTDQIFNCLFLLC